MLRELSTLELYNSILQRQQRSDYIYIYELFETGEYAAKLAVKSGNFFRQRRTYLQGVQDREEENRRIALASEQAENEENPNRNSRSERGKKGKGGGLTGSGAVSLKALFAQGVGGATETAAATGGASSSSSSSLALALAATSTSSCSTTSGEDAIKIKQQIELELQQATASGGGASSNSNFDAIEPTTSTTSGGCEAAEMKGDHGKGRGKTGRGAKDKGGNAGHMGGLEAAIKAVDYMLGHDVGTSKSSHSDELTALLTSLDCDEAVETRRRWNNLRIRCTSGVLQLCGDRIFRDEFFDALGVLDLPMVEVSKSTASSCMEELEHSNIIPPSKKTTSVADKVFNSMQSSLGLTSPPQGMLMPRDLDGNPLFAEARGSASHGKRSKNFYKHSYASHPVPEDPPVIVDVGSAAEPSVARWMAAITRDRTQRAADKNTKLKSGTSTKSSAVSKSSSKSSASGVEKSKSKKAASSGTSASSSKKLASSAVPKKAAQKKFPDANIIKMEAAQNNLGDELEQLLGFVNYDEQLPGGDSSASLLAFADAAICGTTTSTSSGTCSASGKTKNYSGTGSPNFLLQSCPIKASQDLISKELKKPHITCFRDRFLDHIAQEHQVIFVVRQAPRATSRVDDYDDDCGVDPLALAGRSTAGVVQNNDQDADSVPSPRQTRPDYKGLLPTRLWQFLDRIASEKTAYYQQISGERRKELYGGNIGPRKLRSRLLSNFSFVRVQEHFSQSFSEEFEETQRFRYFHQMPTVNCHEAGLGRLMSYCSAFSSIQRLRAGIQSTLVGRDFQVLVARDYAKGGGCTLVPLNVGGKKNNDHAFECGREDALCTNIEGALASGYQHLFGASAAGAKTTVLAITDHQQGGGLDDEDNRTTGVTSCSSSCNQADVDLITTLRSGNASVCGPGDLYPVLFSKQSVMLATPQVPPTMGANVAAVGKGAGSGGGAGPGGGHQQVSASASSSNDQHDVQSGAAGHAISSSTSSTTCSGTGYDNSSSSNMSKQQEEVCNEKNMQQMEVGNVHAQVLDLFNCELGLGSAEDLLESFKLAQELTTTSSKVEQGSSTSCSSSNGGGSCSSSAGTYCLAPIESGRSSNPSSKNNDTEKTTSKSTNSSSTFAGSPCSDLSMQSSRGSGGVKHLGLPSADDGFGSRAASSDEEATHLDELMTFVDSSVINPNTEAENHRMLREEFSLRIPYHHVLPSTLFFVDLEGKKDIDAFVANEDTEYVDHLGRLVLVDEFQGTRNLIRKPPPEIDPARREYYISSRKRHTPLDLSTRYMLAFPTAVLPDIFVGGVSSFDSRILSTLAVSNVVSVMRWTKLGTSAAAESGFTEMWKNNIQPLLDAEVVNEAMQETNKGPAFHYSVEVEDSSDFPYERFRERIFEGLKWMCLDLNALNSHSLARRDFQELHTEASIHLQQSFLSTKVKPVLDILLEAAKRVKEDLPKLEIEEQKLLQEQAAEEQAALLGLGDVGGGDAAAGGNGAGMEIDSFWGVPSCTGAGSAPSGGGDGEGGASGAPGQHLGLGGAAAVVPNGAPCPPGAPGTVPGMQPPGMHQGLFLPNGMMPMPPPPMGGPGMKGAPAPHPAPHFGGKINMMHHPANPFAPPPPPFHQGGTNYPPFGPPGPGVHFPPAAFPPFTPQMKGGFPPGAFPPPGGGKNAAPGLPLGPPGPQHGMSASNEAGRTSHLPQEELSSGATTDGMTSSSASFIDVTTMSVTEKEQKEEKEAPASKQVVKKKANLYAAFNTGGGTSSSSSGKDHHADRSSPMDGGKGGKFNDYHDGRSNKRHRAPDAIEPDAKRPKILQTAKVQHAANVIGSLKLDTLTSAFQKNRIDRDFFQLRAEAGFIPVGEEKMLKKAQPIEVDDTNWLDDWIASYLDTGGQDPVKDSNMENMLAAVEDQIQQVGGASGSSGGEQAVISSSSEQRGEGSHLKIQQEQDETMAEVSSVDFLSSIASHGGLLEAVEDSKKQHGVLEAGRTLLAITSGRCEEEDAANGSFTSSSASSSSCSSKDPSNRRASLTGKGNNTKKNFLADVHVPDLPERAPGYDALNSGLLRDFYTCLEKSSRQNFDCRESEHPLTLFEVLDLDAQQRVVMERFLEACHPIKFDLVQEGAAVLRHALWQIYGSYNPDAEVTRQKVLLHCTDGRSMSPCLIIAYLMFVSGVSYETAYAFVKRQHPRTCIREEYVKHLERMREERCI
ncbi:unnamed protein product [Amoebophrya sp. A25]|nr:unnamed protein product [Amoebophrya sp. A25]|eukprot:GSA25T00020753001.1